jgi:hypothetical protein
MASYEELDAALDAGHLVERCAINQHGEVVKWDKVTSINCTFDLERYRVRKPIDLSVLIKSGIDCEFSESMHDWKCELFSPMEDIITRMSFRALQYKSISRYFDYAKPRMEHWHSWQGDETGQCPLPEGLLVKLEFRDGRIASNYLKYSWDHTNEEFDIIAFKVTGLADGYCWPWEV